MMRIKTPNNDSSEFDACGNTTIAVAEYNGIHIPLCKDCLDSLRESLKEYDDTIFCYKCANFIMSESGWNYGGSCLESLDDKSIFDPTDAGYINPVNCLDTCKNSIKKK